VKKKYKKDYNFVITDNMGDINTSVLEEEISLLLPYADKLFESIFKKKLTKKSKRSKLATGSSASKHSPFLLPKQANRGE
jgi:hypothetical protein